MYNPNSRNNNPYGNSPFGNNRRNNSFGSRYQYQTVYGNSGMTQSSSSLISKVMSLLAFSFIFATLGTFVGFTLPLTFGGYWAVAIAGFVVLFALNVLIQKQGINLILLYLFTFLQGMALGPLVSAYVNAGLSNLLGQAFIITALTSLGLGLYSWTTKRDFSRLGDYLFFGVILLLVTGIIGILFHSTVFTLLISFVGVAIFSGYVLFYVQRAKYMADTLPNAIGLTVSIFITVLNLFIYILQILSIMRDDRR
ncbi:Bax inhibitor-1/YccA family protein [Dictyobacter arantiisoli]|uniref:BAX inhibitor protein n=1 Tax=Dictyobacter arantiisoli TaxID=2014874 RepID=A0A5A5T8N0_9CHLR|nr:Bax inhibitor-1/YccA family protein [Dictyobacter arantiisoli]GCF07625.1 BAX inhibitor protein [Dictyobacter arantiisoli]